MISSTSVCSSSRASLGAHRHSEHDFSRSGVSDGAKCRAGRAASGDPVIDDNDRPAGERHGRAVTEINLSSPFNFLQLARGFARDVVLVNGELGGEVAVDDSLGVGSVHDRAERELGLPRHPNLADQHNIKPSVEALGDLEADRHAAARQGEHNRLFFP
jgi:hypothetical protein